MINGSRDCKFYDHGVTDLRIVFRTSSLLTKVYPEFVSAMEADVIVKDDLNY